MKTANHEDHAATTARLSQNIVSSIGAKILYLATRFSLPPIILASISLEEYGLWAIAFILIAYLGMGAFGVSNVYVRYVAQYHADGETDRIGDLLSTGLMLVTLFAVVTLIALWFGLPVVLTWFSIPEHLLQTAFVLLFGTVAVFMLDLSLGAFVYVLTGLQKIVLQNRIWIASFLLETVLVVVFMLMGLGVLGLLYAFALRYALSISLSVWACFRALPGLRISPLRFNRAHLNLYIHFGGILQISGLLGMFLRSVEKLIAGLFIGVHAVGLFDIAQKFPVMTTSIPSSINASCLPTMTQMHVQGRQQEVSHLYLGSARQVNLLTGFFMGLMAAFAAPLITAWLGADPDLALAPLILSCFTLPFQLNVVTGAASNIYRATGQPARELLYPLSQLLLVLVLTGTGFAVFGVQVGVIVASVATSMILSALLYCAYTNRYMNISQLVFLRQVLLPGVIPYLTGFALFVLFTPWLASVVDSRTGSLLVVLTAGTVYVSVQFALMWYFQLTDVEKNFLRNRFMPRRQTVTGSS
ncbi:MAG: oligosaccharide flippase family protein [Pseudohongiella sp.]|nr:oligosaccharide flippase family protein [Pseudohongiella sp.]